MILVDRCTEKIFLKLFYTFTVRKSSSHSDKALIFWKFLFKILSKVKDILIFFNLWFWPDWRRSLVVCLNEMIWLNFYLITLCWQNLFLYKLSFLSVSVHILDQGHHNHHLITLVVLNFESSNFCSNIIPLDKQYKVKFCVEQSLPCH